MKQISKLQNKMAAGCGVKTLEPSVANNILLYDSIAYVLMLAMLKS
ncbi:hypothetical protein JK636_13715 [Clostridium sp. YIM B02515]|uniref:Uncharacterized protein n=1 Tax=Clostridium rhizosphaerae TaxID=2803861 RepID=A0ABS1TEP3_9CLOT|nr:hypothetical protein [Clostridium rhizosphaerae]